MSNFLEKRRLIVAVLGLIVFSSAQQMVRAQFVVSDAGPLNSAGSFGNPFNSVINYNYAGPNVVTTNLDFQGDLTSTGIGSWRSEARWAFQNTSVPTGNFGFQFQTGAEWTGPDTITASRSIYSWFNTGDNLRFEAFESFNDGGDAVDAIWSNVTFDFNTVANPIDLGSFSLGTSFLFDTFTSSFDTELGLFGSLGNLIATNDDAGGGFQSEIDVGVLPVGDYFLLQSGFNSFYVDRLALAGSSTGNLNLQLNGNTFFSGNHAAGTFTAHRFSVVPEPSSLVLVILTGVTWVRRRQRD